MPKHKINEPRKIDGTAKVMCKAHFGNEFGKSFIFVDFPCPMEERVILVDESDNELGTEEKMKAHVENVMHRAISVFVFNSKGEMMLQRRAKTKYHSPGLWSNTCCSHPRPGEKNADAAHRRLMEEMGFDCELEEIFSFTYNIRLGEKLYEHEFDHVFYGTYDGEPNLNPDETDAYRFVRMKELEEDVKRNPGSYTYWFRVALERVLEHSRKEKTG